MNMTTGQHIWTILGLCLLLPFEVATGADPVIHADWDEPGDPPDLGSDYVVTTTDPDYPDVKLITGSLTWKIWSTDTDNPNDIGDIGNISSPYDQNFKVTIEDDEGGEGARHVKGIDLDPTDPANHSSLNGSITGDLQGDLLVQKASGGSGGTVSLTIAGDAEGNMTIPKLESLTIKGAVASGKTITITEITGSGTVLKCNETSGDFEGNLVLNCDLDSGENISIAGALDGTIDCEGHDIAGTIWPGQKGGTGTITDCDEVTGNVTFGVGGYVFTGAATFGSISGQIQTSASDFGATLTVTDDVTGWIRLLQGDFTSTSSIDIGGDLTGYIYAIGGDMKGTIDIDGDVTYLLIADGDISGDITIGGDLSGSLGADYDYNDAGEITGEVTGGGEFSGDICDDPLEGATELPGNFDDIGFYTPTATICGGYACTCDCASCTTTYDSHTSA